MSFCRAEWTDTKVIDLQNGISIDGYDKFNVVLGKNGSGKSTLLRLIDTQLSGKEACVRYITPERGGELTYEGGIETNLAQNPDWLVGQRRQNRYDSFRQSSVAQFRSLEVLVLRSIERDQKIRGTSFKFDSEVERINSVLDRVRLVRTETAGFEVVRKSDDKKANIRELSSGESELISLSVEILYFAYQCKLPKYIGKENWLLLDEPDVHLHPDLQYRLMKFLLSCVNEIDGRVAIATHSTAILASLCELGADIRVGLKHFGPQALVFKPADAPMKSVLPMFGAHPLSNVFNERPPLIVEGEDDERIWQAAVRRSQGAIKAYPCVAGDIQSMNRYETVARDLIESVYENAKAISIRDRDNDVYEIDDIGPVIRCRLMCRTAENLMVSDDALAEFGTDWDTLRPAIEKWITDNPMHSRHDLAVSFRNCGWDRMNFGLKDLRSVLVGITGSTKPWEVAVGQAIAKLPALQFNGPSCLREFLGQRWCRL